MGSLAATLFGAFGRHGRLAGAVSLLLAIACTVGAVGVVFELFDRPWAVPLLVGVGAAALLFSMLTFGFLFANVWTRDPRFKPMPVDALLAGLPAMAMPFFVCLDCRLLLPFEVAVGRCPRCESSSSCFEVGNAEDLQLVRNALTPDEA